MPIVQASNRGGFNAMTLPPRDLNAGSSGDDVRDLQANLVSLGYAVPPAEQQGSSFAAGTEAAVRQFQTTQSLPVTGVVDAATASALRSVIVGSTYGVSGTVSSPVSAGVNGLTVELVDKNVGADVVLASGVTDAGGGYAIKAVIAKAALGARLKTSPDLQVRVSAGSSLLAT
jgi:peptidoglycan hydrolase-like protein with peptidoglycan-binding domain